MKKYFVFAAAAVAALVSCDKANEGDGVSKVPYPETATVVLNEIDGNSKLIELYNGTKSSVSLEGWTIYKDGSKTIWTGVAGQTIPSKSYLVLYSEDNWANEDETINTNDPSYIEYEGKGQVFHSGISAKKSVKLQLIDASGADVDVFTRGAEPWNDKGYMENKVCSFSRVPTGTGNWAYATPTEGKPNPDAAEGEIEQAK